MKYITTREASKRLDISIAAVHNHWRPKWKTQGRAYKDPVSGWWFIDEKAVGELGKKRKEDIMRTYQIYEHNKPIPKGTDRTRLGWGIRAIIQASNEREAAMHYVKSPVKRSSWKDVFKGKDVISVCPEAGNYSHWLKELTK